MKKVSNIKTRIRELAEKSDLTKEVFFKKLGVTAANFRGKKLETGVNSELLEKIISMYPEVDLHWLLTGQEYFEKNVLTETKIHYRKSETETDYKDELIRTQKRLIDVQKALIDSKDTILSMTKTQQKPPL